MKRHVAAVAAALAAAVATVTASGGAVAAAAAQSPTKPPKGTSTSGSAAGVAGPGDVTAAARAFTGGRHLFVGPGGAPVDVARLNGYIGSQPIFVAVLGPTQRVPDQTVAELSTLTRLNGTYVVLDGPAMRATSNVFPATGVQAVLQNAQAAHPTDPISALEEFVQRLAAGDAKTAQAPSTPAVAAAAASTTNRASSAASLSPWFLALLVPLGAAVGFAVVRARRRTG